MGAPADNGPDRDAAPERETPVDDAWTKGTSMHNDQTTAGLPAGVGPSGVAGAASADHERSATGLDPELVAAGSEQDRTVVAPYAAPNARAAADGSSAALDATIAELKQANAVPDHDRTKLGVGVEAVKPRGGVVLLQPGKGKVPLEKERVLAQPERSPLDLVMRDLEPAAPMRAHASGDSSRFVAALVGDQPPPRIEAEPIDLSALRPVARRSSRLRWIAAGALAVMAVLGTALAWKLTGAGETPAAAASEAAKAIEPPATVAAAATVPAPSNVTAPSVATDPGQAPAAEDPGQPSAPTVSNDVPAPPAPEREEAAEQPSEAAPVPARTTVVVATASEPAARSATPKSLSLAKTSKTASAATKKPSAGKPIATAKVPAPAKKATAAKTTTAKKATSTKTAAKKTTTSKKTTVAKKSTTKKTSTSKSSRTQPTGRRPRRS